MPFVGRIEISVLEEAQPRLLSFEQGNLDFLELPASLAGNVLDGAQLKPAYAKRGVVLHRQVEPTVSFYFFNLDNPVVGGYAPAQIALRRAIAMGFDSAAAVKTLLYGQAIPANSWNIPMAQ